MTQTLTLTHSNRASWLETIWDALHSHRENTLSEFLDCPKADSEWDNICTAMAWITEQMGMEATADGIVPIEQAECARNGHRDDGRGCCADCGAFI